MDTVEDMLNQKEFMKYLKSDNVPCLPQDLNWNSEKAFSRLKERIDAAEKCLKRGENM